MAAEQALLNQAPLKRIGTPGEIALQYSI